MRGHEEVCVGCFERDCFGCSVIGSGWGEDEDPGQTFYFNPEDLHADV